MSMMSIVPYIGPIAFGIMFAYPVYNTGLLLKNKTQGIAQTQWLMYWVLYVLYQHLNEALLVYITEYIPLYPEIEALFFLWLVHPDFLGAVFIWEQLQPFHQPYDEKCFAKLREIFPAPSAQKKFDAAQEETPVKQEVAEKKEEVKKEEPKEEIEKAESKEEVKKEESKGELPKQEEPQEQEPEEQ
eukprot:GEMP01035300.1.p1 GENE.GEMP01035300.1~~GEMP01035300.1.p1  ORF type:complete len:186 (-),score=54.14 GEMP01035300.1:1422-1979(-)